MSEDPTMKAFFSGKYKEEMAAKVEEMTFDDMGYGMGIKGHTTGSYNEFSKLNQESNMYLTNTKIEKLESSNRGSNREDTEVSKLRESIEKVVSIDALIGGETSKFKSGEIPKLLVTYSNIIHNKELNVEWSKLSGTGRNVQENVELTNYYSIPSAYSQGNNWWDSYGILFVGPRVSKGNYLVNIKSKDNRMTSDKVKSSDNLDVVKFVVE